MPFDPDAYLAKGSQKEGGFDPDAYLGKKTPTKTEQFVGSAAATLDLPLSAPGFALGVGAELGATALGEAAKPFTGESDKDIYASGRRIGEQVSSAFSNPMQKVMSLFKDTQGYEQAPVSQALSKFSDVIRHGGEWVEQASKGAVPIEAVQTGADVLMMGGVPGGERLGKMAIEKLSNPTKTDMLREQARREGMGYGETTSSPSVEDIMSQVRAGKPIGAESQMELPFSTSVEEIARRRAAKSKQLDLFASGPIEQAAFKNKKTGEIETSGRKHDVEKKKDTSLEPGFIDRDGKFHTREAAEKIARENGQIEKEQQLEKPEEGLHSGDIRSAEAKKTLGGMTQASFAHLLSDITGEPSHIKDVMELKTIPAETREAMVRYALRQRNLEQPKGEQLTLEEVLPPELSGEQKAFTFDPVEAAKESYKLAEPLLDKAKEIYSKYGEESARLFISQYQHEDTQVKLRATPENIAKDVENLVGQNINNKMSIDRTIYNTASDMEKMAPKDVREFVAEAIDAGRTDRLTGNAKALADKYRSLMKDIGERAKSSGVINGLIEDYVTHIVDWSKSPQTPVREFLDELLGSAPTGPGMSPKSRFGKGRKYETFEELQAAIKDKGLELKTKDLSEIYKEYARSMERAIENRKLIDSLKEVKNASGESLIKKITDQAPIPRGWETLDSSQFRGYAIHPDLMPALKFALEARDPNIFMQAAHTVSQGVKRLNVIGSFFHAKSLLEAMSSAGTPIWTPVKELALSGWDKAFGTEHSGITRALNEYYKGGLGDSVDGWLKSGLVVQVPEDVTRGVLSSGGKMADSLIAKFGPKTNILERSLSLVEKATLGTFDKFTWDFLHTGGKLFIADRYLEQAKLDAMKEGKPFDEANARTEIARFVNNSFGGLNWFDVARQSQTELGKRMAMAAYSPEGRRGLQLLLFAPDWTISTVRAFTTAFPKTLDARKWKPTEGIKGMRRPKTQADYARLYQFKTVLTYLTLLNGINIATSGRPIWDNKDPTRIEFKDGTSLQAMKHAMEPYHWIADPDKTLSNKLGFLPRATIVGFGGLEYASPTAPKLVDTSASGRVAAAFKGALPFQAQAAMQAPEGESVERTVAGTLGFPIYGQTKEQRKQANKERFKKQQELKKRYKQHAKEMGWE